MNLDVAFTNGKITTLDPARSEVSALGIKNGRVAVAGSDNEVLSKVGIETKCIDLNQRRVIPGLNDSHLHVIRAGLFYNLELRWDSVPSISQALL